MKDLTIIIPVNTLDTDEKKQLLLESVSSIDDSNVVIVGPKETLDVLNEIEGLTNYIYTTTVNTTNDTTYAAQVMIALKNVKSKYFSVLEFDDRFSNIWFNNVSLYMEHDDKETFAFFPLTEVVDYQSKISFGYANEAVWASSFSEELGCFDIQSFEDYFNFNASGAVFKTEEFLALGGLKTSLKVVTWYEFILRALYKNKRMFVIPKVGYYHTVNRVGSITMENISTMSDKEAEWWVDLAKKEYFFPQDRKKVYTEEE